MIILYSFKVSDYLHKEELLTTLTSDIYDYSDDEKSDYEIESNSSQKIEKDEYDVTNSETTGISNEVSDDEEEYDNEVDEEDYFDIEIDPKKKEKKEKLRKEKELMEREREKAEKERIEKEKLERIESERKDRERIQKIERERIERQRILLEEKKQKETLQSYELKIDQNLFTKRLGQQLNVTCTSFGNPLKEINWFKSKNLLFNIEKVTQSDSIKLILMFKSLRKRDQGVFTCSFRDDQSINKSVKIIVDSKASLICLFK